MLHSVLSVPRNHRIQNNLRQSAVDYLTRRLGYMGLPVGVQSFFPSRFYKQVRSHATYKYYTTVLYSKDVLLPTTT